MGNRQATGAGIAAVLFALLPAAAEAGGGPELPTPLALALAPAGLSPPPAASGRGAGARGRSPSLAALVAPGTVGAASARAGAPGPAGQAVGPAARPGAVTATVAAAGAADPALGRVYRSRAIGAGVILAWGLLQWNYGERPFHVESEGWFEADSPEGGADKLGHFYTAQVLARVTAALYRNGGLEPVRAAREGALTSIVITTVMEVGDGFSPYGVSGEDLVMNLAGAWAGEVLARRPDWRERLDLRVEYRFNAGASDPSTDYEHARYLLALKPAGFAPLARGPLRWLEFHAGYYVRGYGDAAAPDRRTPYVGLGLNLPLLARAAGLPRTATFLQFYQPPGTSLRAGDTR